MGLIKINNIIYGSNNSADIIYKDTTVEEKLNSMPVFDIEDNTNIKEELSNYLTYGHIINGLNSDATDKVLSAKQGKILNEKINNIDLSYLENNIDSNTQRINSLSNRINNNTESINSLSNNINTDLSNIQDAIEEIGNKVNNQSSNLGGFTPIIDETGKITGYKTTAGGADTVFPFSSLKTVILAKADYNNNCRDMNNIQPDVYNTEYIEIESDIIKFKKACNVLVMGFCQSHVNNGYAQPTLKIGTKTFTYGTRDNYYVTYLNPVLSYVSVNEGDVFSFSKKHQFQIDADNGYGYIVMLSGK